jgi:CubicO group peptidase (beta-lactamase class C family)
MQGHVVTRRQAFIGIAGSLGYAIRSTHGFAAKPIEIDFQKLAAAQGYTAEGPGLVVMSRRNQNEPFFGCVGLARIDDRAPVTPQTMFELASVSKVVTASAILILHERKKLSIADDIRKHLPEFPEYEKSQPVRIRDLLQHTSGLPSYMDLGDIPSKNEGYWVNEDYVAAFAAQKPAPSFAPTTRHEYNNTNYMLLATIIARVTGKSYGTFLKEAIFEPAGMKTAFVHEGPGSIPSVSNRVDAIGYVQNDDSWDEAWGLPPRRKETLLTCGDGAIWCSAVDMAAWDAFLHSSRMIKPATAKLALTPGKTRDGQFLGNGLGWGLYFEGNKLVGYGHSGGWGGFGTYYWHEIPSGRTIVVLGNGRPLDLDKFWYALTEMFNRHPDF